MNTVVMKFGGTSVKTYEAMLSAASIVASEVHRGSRVVVVASACGGMTNKLIEVTELAKAGELDRARIAAEAIARHHEDIAHRCAEPQEALQALAPLLARLRELAEGIALLRECTPRMYAEVLAHGELLSTTLLAHILRHGPVSNARWHDARTFMPTEGGYDSAKASVAEIERRAGTTLLPALSAGEVAVTQGFIGSDADGRTTLLGRGGSDLSAALIGAAIRASLVEIWTDVSGIYTSDPRFVKGAFAIPRMTFSHAGELAFFGAKVLHPDTVRPAVERSIPVRIANTFEPEARGTLLVADDDDSMAPALAVALLGDCHFASATSGGDGQAGALYSSLVSGIDAAGAEIHASLGLEHTHGVLMRTSAAATVQHPPGVTHTECAALCVALSQRRRWNTIAALTTALNHLEPLGVVVVPSRSSVVFLLPRHAGDEALALVHQQILSFHQSHIAADVHQPSELIDHARG